MSTSKKTIDPKNIEKELDVKLPARLRKFFASGEYQKYEEMYVYNLPFYSPSEKFKLKFIRKNFNECLEENGLEMPDDNGAHYIPLMKIVQEFLAVDISNEKCPIALWDHECGFSPHTESLDVFLSGLLKKGEMAPLEKLEKALDKGNALNNKKKHREALIILEEAFEGIELQKAPKTDKMDYDELRTIGQALNLRGVCYENTNNLPKAMADYKQAMAYGNGSAGLNVVSQYIEDKDYPKALEVLAKIEPNSYGYTYFHILNYKGQAFVLTGKAEKAEEAYKAIVKEFSKSDPEKIKKSLEFLTTTAMDGTSAGKIAASILTWFANGRV